MNERIKELAEQSTIYVTGFPILDEQKFAEMIVQECVNSIENNVFTWGLDQAAIKGFCVDAIIDHFGDEE